MFHCLSMRIPKGSNHHLVRCGVLGPKSIDYTFSWTLRDSASQVREGVLKWNPPVSSAAGPSSTTTSAFIPAARRILGFCISGVRVS